MEPWRVIGFLDGIDVLGAIDREKKRVEDRVEERRKKKCAMQNAWTCYVQKKIASWAKTQSKLQHSQEIIKHAILECMKHCYNDRECNAWACEIILATPNPKFLSKQQKSQTFQQK